ncbi:hypothetical protein ACIQUG_27510 [Ensifer sp. NPDC090286]|uniref:hypothetical protein n=1 Tax=Ensifer sp. NPDC090286 TaxID=3363991 RepID=UPI00383AD28D
MNSTALLPHELTQLELVFRDVLRARGLSRQSEDAEVIARRLIEAYQSGVRESGALRRLAGASELLIPRKANQASNSDREVSIRAIAREPHGQITPDELDMLQRTFDRVCIWCGIPRFGKRADRLARYLTDQFRCGERDEDSLFASGMWMEQTSGEASTDA